jgi:hypothetical protein
MDKLFESFDKLNENELAMVLQQVARRMLFLRCTTPDSGFWYDVLMRVGKWLNADPIVNDVEKAILHNPEPDTSGRVRAMRNMRERSGLQLSACKHIVDDWIKHNLDFVHHSVKESFLNRKED